ncbi:MAG: MucR family transcriptional regulator [Thermodesulfobacteriota bacterium]
MKTLVQKAAELVAQQAAESEMTPAQLKSALQRIYNELAKAAPEPEKPSVADRTAAAPLSEEDRPAPPATPRRGRPRKPAPAADLDAKFETLTFLRQHPEKSIKKDKVVCLECGTPFKALSTRHLRLHGLERDTYIDKWSLDPNETLISEVSLGRKGKALEEARAQRARHLGKSEQDEE